MEFLRSNKLIEKFKKIVREYDIDPGGLVDHVIGISSINAFELGCDFGARVYAARDDIFVIHDDDIGIVGDRVYLLSARTENEAMKMLNTVAEELI